MPWQRRGDFAALISALRARHRFDQEFKWTKVGPRFLPFYEDVVEMFFKTNWLAFHCLIVEKGRLRIKDKDLARRRLFTELLTKKVSRCQEAHPERRHTYRVWLDPFHSSYSKADEAIEVIANNVLAKVSVAPRELRLLDRVITKDSKETPAIMLADLFLGAVMASWLGKIESHAKQALVRHAAGFLGWPDLRSDTRPKERKLNIWFLHDRASGARPMPTREVQLRYPLPSSTRTVPPGRR
jgi:hypothetical protein